MNIANMRDLPTKYSNQALLDYTESLTDLYINSTSDQYRKKKGQYFTPKEISLFMVKQFFDIDKKEKIEILDPGAGIGVFESAFCEYIKTFNKNIKMSFDLYETDIDLIPLLRLNLKACEDCMIDEGFEVSFRIFNEDFILSNACAFNNQKETHDSIRGRYDLVISNPPYYRLRKDSLQAAEMSSFVDCPPNIYPLFMTLSAKLLKNSGQMTILTPRSYCSGVYFKKFRKSFFKMVKPYRIHLFDSRKEIFKRYNVLQENIILTAVKSSKEQKNITIS